MTPLLAGAIASSLRDAIDRKLAGSACQAPPVEHDSAFRSNLLRWFSENGRGFPWRRGNTNPWQVLMLEMCLRRTKAEQVAKVADALLTLGKTPDEFLRNSAKLEPALVSLGLNQRSDNLSAAARFIRDELSGRVPDNWQELRSITGVGDYIASAVLCFAFNRTSVLMDTNTMRIARRVLGEGQKHPKWRLRLALRELAGPGGADIRFNQALLDLGALVCTSRAPKCEACPVRAHCDTGAKRVHPF